MRAFLKRFIEEECGGCGCGGTKKSAGASPVGASNRQTIYQVIKDSAVLNEFANLREARAEAVLVGGRVKVTSKAN